MATCLKRADYEKPTSVSGRLRSNGWSTMLVRLGARRQRLDRG